MKKPLLYLSALFIFGMSACDNTSTSTESEELHSEELHAPETGTAELSREEHLLLVKAEEVPVFENVNATMHTYLNALVADYLPLKEALVASDAQQASQAAATLLNTVKAWEGTDLTEEQLAFYQQRAALIQEHLEAIVATTELELQRTHFARLSKSSTELLKAFGTANEAIFYQYCPMAFNNMGGYWLSDNEEVRNPYYGAEMLNCGRVVQQL